MGESGDMLSLDSGGNYKGYIGDVCRMGILGEPDGELVDLLGVIEEIQRARASPIRGGAQGRKFSRRPTSLWTPRPTGHIWILWRMAWASSVMKRHA